MQLAARRGDMGGGGGGGGGGGPRRPMEPGPPPRGVVDCDVAIMWCGDGGVPMLLSRGACAGAWAMSLRRIRVRRFCTW